LYFLLQMFQGFSVGILVSDLLSLGRLEDELDSGGVGWLA